MQSKDALKKIGLDAYTELGKSHKALEEYIDKLGTTVKNGRLTDKDWVLLVRKMVDLVHKHPELRIGQAYMNALCEVEPALYTCITGTDADCFYLDSNLHKFMKYLNGEKADEN